MAENTSESDYGPTTRDAVLAEAIRLHDLRYGNDHCDRKYVQVCHRILPLIFEAGRELRRTSPANGDHA